MAKSKYKYTNFDRRKYFHPEGKMLASFELMLTFLFWGLWAYFIAPLISLGLWFIGVFLFYDRMIAMGGYDAFARALGQYSIVIIVMAITLGLWIFWNQRRYGRHNRRNIIPRHVNSVQTGVYTGLNQETIEILKGSRVTTMHFDEERQPVIESTEGTKISETRSD